jgi:hypothetical protein
VVDTGQGRKTDAHDVHAVVMVALRDTGLHEVVVDTDLQVLRLQCERRDSLSRAHIQGLGRAHRLFGGLLPGGAPVKKSTAQYKRLLATVRPRDPIGRAWRRPIADELTEQTRIEAQLKTLTAELAAAVRARGSQLMDLPGMGLPAPPGSSPTSATWPASRTATTSRPGPAPPRSTPPVESTPGTGSPRAGNRRLTRSCTSPPSFSCATTPRAGPTSGASGTSARAAWRPCAAFKRRAVRRGLSTARRRQPRPWYPTTGGQAREDTPGRLFHPARSSCPRTSTLRISHFLDSHLAR